MVSGAEVEASIRAGLGGPAAGLVGGSAIRAAAAGVMRTAGAFPIGDPGAMRAAAARLRDIAARVRTEADHRRAVLSQCRAWHGPARDRANHYVAADAAELEQEAARLDHAATELDQAATRLLQQQQQWSAGVARLRDNAIRHLQAAAR